MKAPHRVLIYGSSIFLLAIGSQIATQPGVVVEYGAPCTFPTTKPQVVLFERGQPHEKVLWWLLQEGVPLLELDAAGPHMTVFQRRQAAMEQVGDLPHLFAAWSVADA